jgi:hypothetical protein
MNADPESTESLPANFVPIAFDVEFIEPPAEVNLRFNSEGEVEAPLEDGTWIVVGVVNIIIYNRNSMIREVALNLVPAVEHELLGKGSITQDGYVNESNVSWTSNNAGKAFLVFQVPRSGCDLNPRTWEFKSFGVVPAPLKVKVRITRIDPVPLDSVTAVP